MRKPSRLVLVLACLALAAPAWAQSKAEWKLGDVFVAVGGGKYAVFHNNGTSYVSEGTITNGHTAGVTAGCASDATFHLISTDYAVTGLSTGAVDRWTMNADPGSTHNVIQTLSIPAGSTNPTSVVVDAKGNLYTGTADGKGLIVEYPLSNGAYGTPVTLPLGANKVNSGTPWIDLSADGTTMYFTNGGGTVSSFAVAAANPTISSSNFGLQHPSFFGLRVVPVGSTFHDDLLVAAGANIYLLNPADGSIVKTYSVSHERNFEFVTLDPNTSGATSFWAGNPATNHFYRINLSTGTVEEGPFTSSGTISGICAYGDFHANQVQPVSLGAAQHPDANDNVRFASPFPGDTTTVLKLTFSPAPAGTTLPASLSGLEVSGVVSAIDPAAGYSDAIPSGVNFPASGPLPCTPDTAVGGKCLVWVLDDNTDPTGATPPPYSAANYAFAQAGSDDNTRLIRDEDSDITWLVMSLDPAGQTRGTSGYSLNEIPVSQTPDVACGYSSPVGKQTYNFGSAIPFKFSAATSSANCASGATVTNLTSKFGTPFLLLWQMPVQVNGANVSAGNPVDDVKVSGQSGVPPIYRANGGSYILNLKTDSLTPGACYVATTFANQIPAAAVTFCLN